MASDDDTELGLPPSLRYLKVLVTVLTAIMIFGVLTIIALLVIRLNDNGRPILVHPELFDLPAGVGTVGYSVVNDYTVLIGDDGVIRVFSSDTRALIEEHRLQE